MAQGASFKDYSDAFTKTTKHSTVVPPAALTKEDVALRQASEQAKKEQKTKKQLRQIGDIMRRVNGFVFLTCLCGLKLKIPPDYKAHTVRCPRCKRILDIKKQSSELSK